MTLLPVAIAAAVGVGGCSSGDGPVAPPAVAPPAENLTGRWVGINRLETARGGGCLGPTFRSRKGEEETIEVELVETDGTLTGTMSFTGSGNRCTLGGAVDLDRVQFDFGVCEIELFNEVPCNAFIRRNMVLADARFDGSSGDDSIRGTLVISYFTFSVKRGAQTSTSEVAAGTRALGARVPEEGTELLVESTVVLHP